MLYTSPTTKLHLVRRWGLRGRSWFEQRLHRTVGEGVEVHTNVVSLAAMSDHFSTGCIGTVCRPDLAQGHLFKSVKTVSTGIKTERIDGKTHQGV